VLDIEIGQAVEDPLVQVVVGDEILERLGRGGVAAGHRNPEVGEVADHLAERRILAADAGQVVEAQRGQPEDVLVQDSRSPWFGRVQARQAAMIAPASDAYKLDSTGFFLFAHVQGASPTSGVSDGGSSTGL